MPDANTGYGNFEQPKSRKDKQPGAGSGGRGGPPSLTGQKVIEITMSSLCAAVLSKQKTALGHITDLYVREAIAGIHNLYADYFSQLKEQRQTWSLPSTFLKDKDILLKGDVSRQGLIIEQVSIPYQPGMKLIRWYGNRRLCIPIEIRTDFTSTQISLKMIVREIMACTELTEQEAYSLHQDIASAFLEIILDQRRKKSVGLILFKPIGLLRIGNSCSRSSNNPPYDQWIADLNTQIGEFKLVPVFREPKVPSHDQLEPRLLIERVEMPDDKFYRDTSLVKYFASLIHISDLHFEAQILNSEKWLVRYGREMVEKMNSKVRDFVQDMSGHSFPAVTSLSRILRKIIQYRRSMEMQVCVVNTGDLTIGGTASQFMTGHTELAPLLWTESFCS